jgi:hypothetical protein
MSPLNIHPEENVTSPTKKNNKMLKVMLGIGALVLVPVIGTTLAGSIAINANDTKLIFGQGQKAALPCDNDVTITATANYVYGSYRLKSIEVSDLNLTDCADKSIQVSTADTTTDAENEIGMIAPSDVRDTDTAPISATSKVNETTTCEAHYFTCEYSAAKGGSLTFTVQDAILGINAEEIGKILTQQFN